MAMQVASEIGSHRIGMLAAFSYWSDLASNFDEVLEKYTSQVHLTPGADINAMTVLLRRDFRNAASALDQINGSTAAVLNIADPLVCKRQVSSTLVALWRANRSLHKNARAAGLKHISFIVAGDAWRAVGHVSFVLYIPCSGQLSRRSDIPTL